MITGFYASLCAFAVILYIMHIARLRYRYQVSLGDGGEEHLSRFVRAHGNFVETVPLALILMLILEMFGMALWVIHWLGLILLLGRVSHFIGVTTGKSYGPYRMAGILMTFAVYIIAGVLLISKYIMLLLGA